MLLRDASRPAAGEHIFERLRFADSVKRVANDGIHKVQDSQCDPSVVFNPKTQILTELKINYCLVLSAALQGPSLGAIFRGIQACLYPAWRVSARPEGAAS